MRRKSIIFNVLDEKIATIILAAGSSSRFKEPKQLLEYQGSTLIETAVSTAVKTHFGPVITVVGSDEKKVVNALKSYKDKTAIVVNNAWEGGVSSSILAGLEKIQQMDSDIYGVLIMLSDQPLISVNHLVAMVRSHFSSGKKIIASGYGGSFGVPAFFHKSLFHYFDKLEGDKGAKSIISKLKQDVHVIPNPNAELDIDTEEDYKKLLERS